MPIMAETGKILMATAATADNRELATDCCNATDILVVTCNQNRITDDDYTVKLNGHAVGNSSPAQQHSGTLPTVIISK